MKKDRQTIKETLKPGRSAQQPFVPCKEYTCGSAWGLKPGPHSVVHSYYIEYYLPVEEFFSTIGWRCVTTVAHILYQQSRRHHLMHRKIAPAEPSTGVLGR